MKVTVEDILVKLAMGYATLKLDSWHSRFVQSVYGHVYRDRPLSTEQARIVLKLARRNRADLVAKCDVREGDLDQLLCMPIYRHPPYESAKFPREVRYIGGNKLAFRFKLDTMVRDDLKALLRTPTFPGTVPEDLPHWNAKEKLWIVSVTSDNIEQVMKLIAAHRFHYDDDVAGYLATATNSREGISRFVLEGDKIHVTVCDNEFLAQWIGLALGGEQV